jgi:hypothetical protein
VLRGRNRGMRPGLRRSRASCELNRCNAEELRPDSPPLTPPACRRGVPAPRTKSSARTPSRKREGRETYRTVR